jgi:hypothetical protein
MLRPDSMRSARHLAAHGCGDRAARVEAAARRRVDRVRRIARKRRLFVRLSGSIDGIEDSSARV